MPSSRGSYPGMEPRAPTLQADSSQSEPPGKPVVCWGLIGKKAWDFACGSVAKTPQSQCRGPGFDPWSVN